MFYTPNFELQPGNAPGIGEADRTMLRIWAAVFRQGLQDWAAEDFGQRLRINLPDDYRPGDSARWFESNSRAVGSFCWLCDLFEIHPDQARSMARLKKRELVRGVGQRFWLLRGLQHIVAEIVLDSRVAAPIIRTVASHLTTTNRE